MVGMVKGVRPEILFKKPRGGRHSPIPWEARRGSILRSTKFLVLRAKKNPEKNPSVTKPKKPLGGPLRLVWLALGSVRNVIGAVLPSVREGCDT